MPINILYIVPYVPDLIRVRSYNLIRHLTARGHRVTLLTVWTDPKERRQIEQLKTICVDVQADHLPRWRSLANALQALPTLNPLQVVYCWQPALAKRAVRLVTNGKREPGFDVVHVEHLRGARYGLSIKSASVTSHTPPIIWDSVDSISSLFRQTAASSHSRINRWIARFELTRTERYEEWLTSQFDHILVTSSSDKSAFVSLARKIKLHPRQTDSRAAISVLRNGVDLDYFSPDSSVPRESAALVVSGKMSYHANVTMALHLVNDIMPLVWSECADVKIWIVGKDPPDHLLSLTSDPRIQVTGTVHDIRPFIQRATIAVAPLTYGAGIQNKVLEAMACGTPLIATPQAISALDVVPGKDLMVAQTPEDFTKAILVLLRDSERRITIGNQGRLYVERNHQWITSVIQLERIYKQAIERKASIDRSSQRTLS